MKKKQEHLLEKINVCRGFFANYGCFRLWINLFFFQFSLKITHKLSNRMQEEYRRYQLQDPGHNESLQTFLAGN